MKYCAALMGAFLAFTAYSESPALAITLTASNDCAIPGDVTLSVQEENAAIARCFFTSIINEKRVDLIDKVMDLDNFIDYLFPDQPYQGTGQFKYGVNLYLAAFPDLQVFIHELTAEGDKVVLDFSLRGTHTGQEIYGFQPSGNPIDTRALTTVQFDNRRIVARWLEEDTQVLIDQLSAKPASIPETTSEWSLLAFGALGTGWMLKRKRKQKAVQGVN